MSLFAGKNENLIWVIVIFVILICTCNDNNNGCHEDVLGDSNQGNNCGCNCGHIHECCECHKYKEQASP